MELHLVGIDLAKRSFQIHGADEKGCPLMKRRVSCAWLPIFLAQLEACLSAHYWGRVCRDLGHKVRLVPPQYARVYVKTHKNDPADAEGIVEAASRRNMRFVPLKSEEQQSVQALHRVRVRLRRGRTVLGNEIRDCWANLVSAFLRRSTGCGANWTPCSWIIVFAYRQ